jgi:virginiamycin B lyase
MLMSLPHSSIRWVLPFAVLVACLLLASSAAAESRLYWTNNQSGTIGTATRAGTEVNQSLFEASEEPFGIAADSTHVFWSDEGTNELGRATLAGAEVDPSFVAEGGSVPEGMVVDANYLYWANLAENAIGRVKLDGSEPDRHFIQLAASSFPEAVAIEGTHLYWTASGNGGSIGRSNLAGGEVEPEFITAMTGAVFAIAVNAGHIYWTESTAIGRAAIDGSSPELGWISGLSNASGLALDNEHLFWTSFTGNSIARANLDGTGVEPNFITGASFPDMIAISQNATTTAGGASATEVAVGTGVQGSATVSGGEATSGTVVFSLYGPGDDTCTGTPIATYPVAVTGNGTYLSPAASPTVAGTYHWVARYSGDSINAPSTSSCKAGAFTVAAAKAPGAKTTPTVAGTSGSLRLLKVTRNRHTGTGRVTFHLPTAGKLTIGGKGVKTRSATAAAAGKVVVTLIPKGAYKARLQSRHRGFTRLKVTFRPTASPVVKLTRRVRLVKRAAAGG